VSHVSPTSTAAGAGVRAVLLDIEGTTTPIAFVTEVLFPYARAHLRSYLSAHAGEPEHEALLTRLREEHDAARQSGEPVPPWADAPPQARQSAIAAYVEFLMDRDRKSTALKDLQGRICEEGYRGGALRSEVFPDVAPALRRWRDRGIAAGIFSSGSVLAQQLLFGHSSSGDLTGLLHWHFDTRIGAKGDPASYERIAQTIGVPAESCLFLSDVPRELAAARASRMQVRLVVRPGNAPVPPGHDFPIIENLDAI
jgi:enolase-phosphatase E1